MSTSNIKSPLVIRQGYIKSWSGNISRLEIYNSILNWELGKLNVLLVACVEENNRLIVFYYKWIQSSYTSKRVQKLWIRSRSAAMVVGQAKKTELNYWKTPARRSRFAKGLALIESNVVNQKFYQMPLSVQVAIKRGLVERGSTRFVDLQFENIIKWAGYSFQLINIKQFMQDAPILKGSLKSVFHILDMITLIDLVSLGVCQVELLGKLIGKILERSSKRGLFLRSLRIFSKLPNLVKRYDIKENLGSQLRCWDWNIKITGKVGGMGRTKIYNVFATKLPLHTIDRTVNYSETVVNTKAGVFSIKVWGS